MGFTEETVRFKLDDSNKKEISETLTDVYASLNDKGYNPINQIVGYVLSGDPAYVPRYNNARNQIRKYERDEIVEELVRYYLKRTRSRSIIYENYGIGRRFKNSRGGH